MFVVVCVTEQRAHSDQDNGREMSFLAVNGERAWRATGSNDFGWHVTELDTDLCAALETSHLGVDLDDVMARLDDVADGSIVLGSSSFRSGASTDEFESYLEDFEGITIDTSYYSSFAFAATKISAISTGTHSSASGSYGPAFHFATHYGRTTPGTANDTGAFSFLFGKIIVLYFLLHLRVFILLMLQS